MKQYKLASSTWDKKELEAIQSVIDKDMYTMGDSVREFENNFSNFMNTKYSVMVSSGSTANLLATAALFFTKNPKYFRLCNCPVVRTKFI
jgi:CDP-6-deoxy-D-xylo-4-hexulose-3-dehydrase